MFRMVPRELIRIISSVCASTSPKSYQLFPLLSFFCLNLVMSISLQAQNANNYWFFGNRAGIQFTAGGVTTLTTGQLVGYEGCATVSDDVTGDLLFYSNGLQIWNSLHDIMPNGDGLLGGTFTSSTQGVIIVPQPGSDSRYFVFTVDETIGGAVNGFRYSVVDMTLDGGLGDVVAAEKNILIQTNTTERLAVAVNGDGSGYWIVMHERDNAVFKAFLLTSAGLDLTPVVSTAGAIHSTAPVTDGDGTMGCMKFNHAFTQLAVAIFGNKEIEVFNFNNCTGTLTAAYGFETLDNPYGVEFSPDNNLLYYSLYYDAGFTGAVYQVDVSDAIPGAPVLVGLSSSFNFQSVGTLQMAPDGKMYLAINSEDWLSAITSPNTPGVGCNFVDQAVFLPPIGLSPTTGIFGLPPAILPLTPTEFPIAAFEITAMELCAEDSTFFQFTTDLPYETATINFGDGTFEGAVDPGDMPAHIYTEPGSYIVTAIVNFGCNTDTFTTDISIIDCSTPDSIDYSCSLEIPNAFSPNADGINDLFGPVVNCFAGTFQLDIYNRWGERVYSTNQLSLPWDGTYAGNPAPLGVYVYMLQTTSATGLSQLESGNVTLLR